MGLFSRDDQAPEVQPETLYDKLTLSADEHFGDSYFEPDEQIPTQAPVSRSGYGIDDAIELMRRLPQDHSELVVTVVKETLESTQVNIADIIEDANIKSAQIEAQHSTLASEIEALQAQINEREEKMQQLQENLNETSAVRQKLQLAIELSQPKVAATVSPAAAHQDAPAKPEQSSGHLHEVNAESAPMLNDSPVELNPSISRSSRRGGIRPH